MTNETHELDTLLPSPVEIGITAVTLLHVVLLVVVVVQLLRGKMALPEGTLGVLWLILLFGVPVVGPLLVLTWQGRVDRYWARTERTAG
jgi:hypothetical protein